MDMFFADPGDVPVPPDEVRIRELKVDPYPDGRRVRVNIDVTPFQKKPQGEVVIRDEEGNVETTANIIEPIENRIEITMHLRKPDTAGQYTVHVRLMYAQEFVDSEDGDEEVVRPEVKEIDQAEISFEITKS